MLQRLPNGNIAISVCSIVVSFRVPASECSVLRNADRTTASERSVLWIPEWRSKHQGSRWRALTALRTGHTISCTDRIEQIISSTTMKGRHSTRDCVRTASTTSGSLRPAIGVYAPRTSETMIQNTQLMRGCGRISGSKRRGRVGIKQELR